MSRPTRLCPFIILLHLRLYYSYRIDIVSCVDPNGVNGFCRAAEDCGSGNFQPTTCLEGQVCCPAGEISKQKCEKYAEAVFSTDDVATLMAFAPQSSEKTDQCGISGVPLIVGGEKVKPMEFPHMAALGYGDEPNVKWQCGGSLISEQFILTAAHCVENQQDGPPKFVKLGAIDVQNDVENVQVYGISKHIIHPKFHPQTKHNDIALLKLEKEVTFTSFVRPACVDYIGNITEDKVIATGWGKMHHEDTAGSPDLLKVLLDLLDKASCDKAFKRKIPKGLIYSQLCSGVLTGGKDTCQGDSGGPLQTVMRQPYCMYDVIGVTSFGSTCGYAWAPAVYTRVFTYVPWIEGIVWAGDQ